MDEVNRYGRSHQVHSASHSQNHHDLIYNERSRYSTNFPSGFIPPVGAYYPTAQPTNKAVLNPSVDYFNSNYIKQVPPLNAHQASHYIPSRSAYSHQSTTIPGYHHHQNYPHNHTPQYEDPYRHRSRHHTIQHHYSDGHHGQQSYPNYPVPGANLAYSHNQKLSFSKSMNDFYTPNVQNANPTHHYPNPLPNPTTPTVHHAPHFGIKYTSQTIVPPMTQQKPLNHHVPTTQSSQKTANNCYYDTPNPVIDMNHPLVDLEEQINSVKILKSSRDNTSYDNNSLNYDYRIVIFYPIVHRWLCSNGPHISHTHSTNLTNYGYSTMDEFVMGSRNFALDENLKDKNLRDYLSSWNETEEEDTSAGVASNAEKKESNNNQSAHENFESCKYLQQALDEQLPPLHSGVIVANVQNGTGNLPDILIDLEKTKDDNPKVGQETTEVGEKLYILETYDVPHSELNKYKHLSVINELPKNVVPIHDSADSLKFLEEIESNRDKYYETELESEVVYDERKKDEEKKAEQSMPTIVLDDDEPEEVDEDITENVVKEKTKVEEQPPVDQVDQIVENKIEAVPEATVEPEKKTDDDSFKVPHYIPKYRKRRYQFDSYDYPRFPKRARRSSIEDFLHCEVKLPKPKPPVRFNPTQLFSICVATLNSREYRRYAKADLARRQELAKRSSIEGVEEQTVKGDEQLQSVTAEKSEVRRIEQTEALAKKSWVPETTECRETTMESEHAATSPMDSDATMECNDNSDEEAHMEPLPTVLPMESDISAKSVETQSMDRDISTECHNENEEPVESVPESLPMDSDISSECHDSNDKEEHIESVPETPQMESDIPMECQDNIPEEEHDEVLSGAPSMESDSSSERNDNNAEEKHDEALSEAPSMESDISSGCHDSNDKEASPEESPQKESHIFEQHVEATSMDCDESNYQEKEQESSPKRTREEIQPEEPSLENEVYVAAEIKDQTNEEASSEDQSDTSDSMFDTAESQEVSLVGAQMENDVVVPLDYSIEKNQQELSIGTQEMPFSSPERETMEQDNDTESVIDLSQVTLSEVKHIATETIEEVLATQSESSKDDEVEEVAQNHVKQETKISTRDSAIILEESDHEEESHERSSEPDESGFTEGKSNSESESGAPIEVEDSADDADDDVFEQVLESQSKCERVSVIVDDAKEIEIQPIEEPVVHKTVESNEVANVEQEKRELLEEELSVEEKDEASVEEETVIDLTPAPEDNRVTVIQKTESIESMDMDQPTRCFNPPALRELTNAAFECYRVLYDYQRVPPLRTLCYEYLLENNSLPQPQSLQKICEQFICNNRHLFIIEEVRSEPPRLQELCQKVLNETNIIIDVNDFCIIDDEVEQEKETEGRVFIVEDDHGSIEDLLRESEDMGGDVIVLSDDVGDEHEIFFEDAGCSEEVQVTLESSQSLSDSDNEIYRKVEREIERMMTTSSDEEDDASNRCDAMVMQEEFDNEFYSFVGGDECIQYEEVIPVNKQAYRRESLINDLQRKYMVPKGRTLTCRLKLLRKYVYYQRFIKTRDHGMQSKRRFFCRKLNCLRRKIDAMRRSVSVSVIDDDSDSNSSTFSTVSSSSSSSSRSGRSSNSSSASSASGNSSESEEEEAATETETVEQSSAHASEDSSASSSVGERLIETNNNQLDLSTVTKPAKIESQQFAKEEDNSSNSSDSRSRGFIRRSVNISPLVKKKKLSFEESLLSIEKMYKKTSSPSQSTSSPSHSNSSSPVPVRARILTNANCGPNVVVNVNNNREAPRKLIIPSYKIFNQALAIPPPADNEASRTSRQPFRRRNSSAGSSCSSSSSSTRCHLVNCTQRSSGLIRVNYPNKPSPPRKSSASSSSSVNNAVTRSHAIPAGFDRRIPFVRLERIDYVEKLAEKYRQQQRHQQHHQQQEQFAKLRQRRKSTFS
ncbi:uncharacterized protein LOC134210468 [Armigeres subalbatus]|uniref:uncharacterized protein LOC134210468 n=1 Tax=Armigeres subalbatus TaxID=124917 RepID=UPI002ED573D5